MRRSLILLAFLCLSGVLSAVVVGSSSNADEGPSDSSRPALPPGFDADHSNLLPAAARDFQSFRLYSVGDSFEGNELKAITRRVGPLTAGDASGHADFVNFIYGDCDAASGAGCAPPLQVQVWPACQRSRASYQLTPAPEARPLPRHDVSVRGAPAAWFEDGRRLELYTGATTIVLFGEGRGQLARAAAALRGVNHALGAGRPLPAPVRGALEGDAPC